jgi:hypothetical protein
MEHNIIFLVACMYIYNLNRLLKVDSGNSFRPLHPWKKSILATEMLIFVFLPKLKHDKAKVVQTLLFVNGIKTLLQTLFGTRLPTIMGGSYAYVVPVLSIIRDPSIAQIADGHTVSMQLSSFIFFFCISKTDVCVRLKKN